MKVSFHWLDRKRAVILAAVLAGVLVLAVCLVFVFSNGKTPSSQTPQEGQTQQKNPAQEVPASSSSDGEGVVSSAAIALSSVSHSSRPASSAPSQSVPVTSRPASGNSGLVISPEKTEEDSFDIDQLVPVSSTKAPSSVPPSKSSTARPSASTTVRPAVTTVATTKPPVTTTTTLRPTQTDPPATTRAPQPSMSFKEDDPSAGWSPLRPL